VIFQGVEICILTDESLQDLCCLLRLAWQRECLRKLSRATRDLVAALLKERRRLNPGFLSTLAELVERGKVQIHCRVV
jgi:hypothetical protein